MNRQQLNITVGSDVILNVTLVHEEEVLIPALIDNLEANLISGLGKRTALETELGADYITIKIPWVKGRLAGCHSLEVKGSINGLAWAAIGKGLIRYTNATEAGAESVTVEADAYDVTMEAGYHYSDSPIAAVHVSVDDEYGTPSADVTYRQRVLGLDFHNLRGNGITDIEQITTSQESGGENVVRITLENGSSFDIVFRNGEKGDTVILGDGDEYTLYNMPGQHTDGAMTQKATVELFNTLPSFFRNYTDLIYTVEEDGFFVCDSDWNVALKVDNNGFNAASIDENIISLIGFGLNIFRTVEDGAFVIDNNGKIGADLSMSSGSLNYKTLR